MNFRFKVKYFRLKSTLKYGIVMAKKVLFTMSCKKVQNSVQTVVQKRQRKMEN
jgi:hypothetical protein